MKHSFIDEYSGLDSFIHKLDPRAKLISSLAFIIAIVMTPANIWKVYAVYLIALMAMVYLARLPFRYVLKRSLIILPFVLMITIFVPFFKQGQEAWGCNIGIWHVAVTYQGLSTLINVTIKAWLSMLCLTIMTSTTKFADMLEGMYLLKVPAVFVQIISFMYRYLFVLVDQAMRMQIAIDSRNFGANRELIFKTIGNIIGSLFIRSYERGERIYAAMLSRGYNGEIPSVHKLRFRFRDACFVSSLAALIIFPVILWW